VRREVARVVEEKVVGDAAGVRIEHASQIEGAELLVVLHAPFGS
jgi:hypothetical protein